MHRKLQPNPRFNPSKTIRAKRRSFDPAPPPQINPNIQHIVQPNCTHPERACARYLKKPPSAGREEKPLPHRSHLYNYRLREPTAGGSVTKRADDAREENSRRDGHQYTRSLLQHGLFSPSSCQKCRPASACATGSERGHFIFRHSAVTWEDARPPAVLINADRARLLGTERRMSFCHHCAVLLFFWSKVHWRMFGLESGWGLFIFLTEMSGFSRFWKVSYGLGDICTKYRVWPCTAVSTEQGIHPSYSSNFIHFNETEGTRFYQIYCWANAISLMNILGQRS